MIDFGFKMIKFVIKPAPVTHEIEFAADVHDD